MKHINKKLSLQSETLRTLQSTQLASARGGGGSFPTVYTCAGCPTNLTCTTVGGGGGGGGGTSLSSSDFMCGRLP